MLESLHVKNLALIEEEEIFFDKALNILTGETGAGKSIILGSINLALGARSNTDVIRTGAEYALVELSFALSPEEKKKLGSLDIDIDGEESLVISRRIMNGKSVSRVNGETVSASTIRDIAEVLIDIYGQNENQSLLKSSTYEKMLDEYSGEKVLKNLETLREDKKRYQSLLDELNNENSDMDVISREKSLLEYEIEQIANADLKTGEDEELENRFRFLSNAQKIMETVAKVHSITGYDENGSAGSLIGNAVSELKGIVQYDDRLGSISEDAVAIESLLSDLNRSLSSYEDSMSFDEEEFNNVDQRLTLINDLKSRFGSSIDEILSELESKQSRLDKLNDFDNYLNGLKKEIETLKKKMLDECAIISSERKKAAPGLSKELKDAMEGLNFKNIELEITVTPNEENIKNTGYDDIEFLISLNTGEQLKPIRNVASGGELSRIMLAIKSVFADADDVPTLIFDEIDAGISGVTAYKVAQKMDELSKGHQLICITHLPQIASMADSHYLIEKTVEDGRTHTGITKLDEEGSVRELARMLGNEEITEASLMNAREMKKGKKG